MAAVAAVALVGVAAPTAHASTLIDRNATQVRLRVDHWGRALVAYRAHGKVWHVLAWGAINARTPEASRPQVSFRVDYSGGWSINHVLPLIWKPFLNACRPYSGPRLPWFVAGCTAPDGSFWALQSWKRMLPNYGVAPGRDLEAARELRLSHWSGELPVFTVHQDWAYHRFEDLYGSYTYMGHPMYGFHTTSHGAPLDGYGNLIYVDTFNSAYGSGWRRENSFVTHNPTGVFCYGFFPHSAHPAGNGTKYRATIVGAGVLPDQYWHGDSLGAYDRDRDAQANAERHASFADRLCSYN